MSSFASNQENLPRELSPEARKLEKAKLLKLKFKEKKRLKKLAEKGEFPSAPITAGTADNDQRRGVRANNEGSSSSDMMKNLLGITPRTAMGNQIMLLLSLCSANTRYYCCRTANFKSFLFHVIFVGCYLQKSISLNAETLRRKEDFWN